MKRNISTTLGVFVILAVSILFGFLLLRSSSPLADTAEQGVDTLQKLEELQERLDQNNELEN